MITSYPPELSAGGSKWDACKALLAVGWLWPSDNDDDEEEEDEDEEDDNDDDLRIGE